MKFKYLVITGALVVGLMTGCSSNRSGVDEQESSKTMYSSDVVQESSEVMYDNEDSQESSELQLDEGVEVVLDLYDKLYDSSMDLSRLSTGYNGYPIVDNNYLTSYTKEFSELGLYGDTDDEYGNPSKGFLVEPNELYIEGLIINTPDFQSLDSLCNILSELSSKYYMNYGTENMYHAWELNEYSAEDLKDWIVSEYDIERSFMFTCNYERTDDTNAVTLELHFWVNDTNEVDGIGVVFNPGLNNNEDYKADDTVYSVFNDLQLNCNNKIKFGFGNWKGR